MILLQAHTALASAPNSPVCVYRARSMPHVHSRDEGKVAILRALSESLCGAILFLPPQISSGVISDAITTTEWGYHISHRNVVGIN